MMQLRMTRGLMVLAVAAATASLGCGSKDDRTDIPPTPYVVPIRFANAGTAPVFIGQGCVLELTILDLDRARDVTPTYGCACECSSSSCTGPVLCGPCYDQPLE